jgi:glycosyltransferase involved in cell wall biosynthesis
MRALYITQYLAFNDEPGANRQWDLLQTFARRGHRADVIISGQHYLEAAGGNRQRAAREEWAGGTLYRLAGLRGYRKSTLRRVANYLAFATRAAVLGLRLHGYDRVLASTPSPFVGVVGWIAAVRNRASLWIEVRDVWPEAAMETGLIRSRVLIRLCRRLNAFVYARAERIVALTPGIRRHLVATYGIEPERIDVIPNGWARDVFEHPGPRPDLESLGMRTDAFKVAYAGAFGVGNNDIPTILEAARLLRDAPDIQFVFIGDGERRALIESWRARHGLTNVLLIGPQPKNVIPHFLAAVQVCVLTLPPGEFFEIYLQNKIFDYLGSGRPVVAAVAGDQADLIRACHGGVVVPPGNPHELACAIVRLQSDAPARDEMGRQARAYVASHFDRADLIDGYVDAFETVGS